MSKELTKPTAEQIKAAANAAEVHGFMAQRMYPGNTGAKQASTGVTPEQALADVKKANDWLAKRHAKKAKVQEVVRASLKI